jgi:hypothetical protein
MSGGVTVAEAYISTLEPGLLQVPLLGWLIEEGVTYLAQFLSTAEQNFIDNIVINVQTGEEKSDVISAAVAYQIALQSKDQAAIAQATTALMSAYKAAISFDGVAVTQ